MHTDIHSHTHSEVGIHTHSKGEDREKVGTHTYLATYTKGGRIQIDRWKGGYIFGEMGGSEGGNTHTYTHTHT